MSKLLSLFHNFSISQGSLCGGNERALIKQPLIHCIVICDTKEKLSQLKPWRGTPLIIHPKPLQSSEATACSVSLRLSLYVIPDSCFSYVTKDRIVIDISGCAVLQQNIRGNEWKYIITFVWFFLEEQTQAQNPRWINQPINEFVASSREDKTLLGHVLPRKWKQKKFFFLHKEYEVWYITYSDLLYKSNLLNYKYICEVVLIADRVIVHPKILFLYIYIYLQVLVI